MKTKVLTLILSLCALACSSPKSKETNTSLITNGVEVLYFHAKQRCATCLAIEKNTKALLEESFTNEMKDSIIVFRSLEITENQDIAQKYQVSFSSLFLVNINNGEETPVDLTDFAFAKARTAPDEFKTEVRRSILTMLE